MRADPLRDLQAWYLSNCDGDWEHATNVKIVTLDNPGWHVMVLLTGTTSEDRSFTPLNEERTPADWIHCRVEDDGAFHGYGGALNLGELLTVFLHFANPS